MILRPYKRIKELEEKIRELEVDYFEYRDLKKEKEDRLRKEREGLHNPTALCAVSIRVQTQQQMRRLGGN